MNSRNRYPLAGFSSLVVQLFRSRGQRGFWTDVGDLRRTGRPGRNGMSIAFKE